MKAMSSGQDGSGQDGSAQDGSGADELRRISVGTLAHYEHTAQQFRAGTGDHDVRQNIEALLRHVRAPPPFTLLDFGCGPGRDLKTFNALGHTAIGLDGTAAFVAMARTSGCEVWQQDFLDLHLPVARFDGIFANATLLHVPSRRLPHVLQQLHAALRPDGVLFSSNPHGNNQEGWNHGRFGVYHDLQSWRQYLTQAHFQELEHYYRPTGLPREQQPWLASVWRRLDR